MLVLLAAVTGCGMQKAEPSAVGSIEPETGQTGYEAPETAETEEAEKIAEEENAAENVMPVEQPVLLLSDAQGRYAVSDSAIYFVSGENVYRLDREKDELEVLTGFAEKEENLLTENFHMEDPVYLSGNYLYYYRSVYQEDTKQTDTAVWKMDIRSGEKERLALPVDAVTITDIYAVNGQLYLWYTKNEGDIYEDTYEAYRLDAAGKVQDTITGEAEDVYYAMPDGYEDALWKYPYQMTHYDKLLLRSEEDWNAYVLYDESAGEIEQVLRAYDVPYYDGQHMIYRPETDWDTQDRTYIYLDTESRVERELPYRLKDILGGDAEGIYYTDYQDEDRFVSSVEEKLYYATYAELEEGGQGTLLAEISKSGYVKNNLDLLTTCLLALQPGEYYTVEAHEGDTVLVHVQTEGAEQTRTTCGILAKSKTAETGEYHYISGYQRCPECGEMVWNAYGESFKIEEKQAGDAIINEKLREIATQDIQGSTEAFEGEACDEHQDEFLRALCNSYSCLIECVCYGERYIGFISNEYIYYRGAAHGMPYTGFHLFDRNTGQELYIDDILATSGEELNALLVQKFADYEYAEDLDMDYIRENAGFYTDHVLQAGNYYLTEEGMVYFFGSYEVACYAAGMPEVEIPYEELEWKIELGGES